MPDCDKPIANPLIVLREEFDDWAILFDPDTGNSFGLNPTGVYLWKRLDGEHWIDDLLEDLRRDAKDVPKEAGEHLIAFVDGLTKQGLAGYEAEQANDGRGRLSSCPTRVSEKLPGGAREAGQLRGGPLRYEQPRLQTFRLESAQGVGCSNGSLASGCQTGGNIYNACANGNVAGCNSNKSCCNGSHDNPPDCLSGAGPL